MAFNINSTINMKSINKVGNITNNTAFKDKFYDDVEKGTYEKIDYNIEADINVEKGIETAAKVTEERIKKEEEARKNKEKEKSKKKDVFVQEKETGASVWDYCRTIIGGGVEGFLGVGEGVVDAHLYGTGLTIKLFTWGNYGDALAYDAVGYDFSGKVESAINDGVNEDIKNSNWSNIPRFVGHGTGYQALSKVPFVGIALAAQGGAGKEAEKSINKQMAETGTINDWTVLYRSFLGSIEGFAGSRLSKAGSKFKDIGKAGVIEGAKNLSKQGIAGWFKSQGPVFWGAAKSAVKDPIIWVDTAGVTVKKFESIITGNYSKMDLALDLLGIPTSVKFWDGVGASGLEFLNMFK